MLSYVIEKVKNKSILYMSNVFMLAGNVIRQILCSLQATDICQCGHYNIVGFTTQFPFRENDVYHFGFIIILSRVTQGGVICFCFLCQIKYKE